MGLSTSPMSSHPTVRPATRIGTPWSRAAGRRVPTALPSESSRTRPASSVRIRRWPIIRHIARFIPMGGCMGPMPGMGIGMSSSTASTPSQLPTRA